MKVMLYILLALQILSGVFLFFVFITNTWYLGIIYLLVSLLSSTLVVVVIDNKNRIESLEYNNDKIFAKLKNLESDNYISYPTPSANPNKNIAIGAWECINCGTINKAETSNCSNCNADYLPALNPTVNPNAKKKKVSRWIKYK